jgi:hypothetical protein
MATMKDSTGETADQSAVIATLMEVLLSLNHSVQCLADTCAPCAPSLSPRERWSELRANGAMRVDIDARMMRLGLGRREATLRAEWTSDGLRVAASDLTGIEGLAVNGEFAETSGDDDWKWVQGTAGLKVGAPVTVVAFAGTGVRAVWAGLVPEPGRLGSDASTVAQA